MRRGLFCSWLRMSLRDQYLRSWALYRQMTMPDDGRPLLLCNAMPKSGTHLLFQILYAIPGFAPWDHIVASESLTGFTNSARHVQWKLGCAPPASIVRSHIYYSQEMLSVLSHRPWRRFLMLRDPRDVVVSFARWAAREQRLPLHTYFTEVLTEEPERILATIEGIAPGVPADQLVGLPSLANQWKRFAGWLQDPGTFVVQFEDLVGRTGGGEDVKRFDVVRGIFDWLNISSETIDIEKQFSSDLLTSKASATFHKGRIGSWRECFTDQHKERFKAITGTLLTDLGYETNTDW